MESKELEKQAETAPEKQPEKRPARQREGPETERPSFELTKQRFTVRKDLEITEQDHRGEKFYVIKDPLALRYFRLSDLEFHVFQLMDGANTVDDIKTKIEDEFSDVELDVQTILTFAYSLKGINFLERVFIREDKVLFERAQQRRKMLSLWTQIKNILFIKLPLVDPDRFFEFLRPYCRVFFTAWFLIFCVLLFVLAFWELFHRFADRVPWEQLFTLSPKNLIYFWIVFVVAKIFHEIGHGVTCKHYGGEVHEMGFLLLVLMPCLYCDVSDAWIFKKRYQKLLVSAAGIVVELVLAAMACIVWAFSDINLVKGLAYRMMLLCSVSSILFNANPLMKFDGYYMLSDYLEIPNLRSRSTAYFGGYIKQKFLGIEQPESHMNEEDASIYFVYGFGSTIWIWMLMFSICAVMLEKFYALGLWITLSTVIGMFVMPVRKAVMYVTTHRREIKVKKHNVAITGAAVVVFLAVAFLVPMDTWVRTAFVVKPVTEQDMKATIPGHVADFLVKEGQIVKEGQPLAVLQNDDLEERVRNLRNDIDRTKRRIQMATGTNQTAEALRLQGDLKTVEDLLAAQLTRVKRQTIVAPFDGVVVRTDPKERLDAELIVGRAYKPGEVVCTVAKLDKVMMKAYVEELDEPKVKKDARAVAKVGAYPDEEFEAKVEDIGKAGDRFVREAEVLNLVPVVRTQQGNVSAVVHYEAVLQFDDEEAMKKLKPGLTGEAKIYAGKRTIAERVWTWAYIKLQTMFRF